MKPGKALMHQKTTLPNGLRILTESMPHTRSVSVSFFIGAGSRYEPPERAGVSHFVEHLCFKGTERRGSAREVSEAIEGVGGLLNGGTDREMTIYWSKIARPHFAAALDVLVDMLRHSKFENGEVEKERKVIIEELNASYDSPYQRANMLIDEVIWPGQPLGRDVAGSKETVTGLSRQMVLDYCKQQYSPTNTVVSVAGEVIHEEVASALGEAMGDWPAAGPAPLFPAQDGQSAPQLRVEYRKSEQAHLCLAVRGLPSLHPDRFTLDLLNVILGEGMSSRLFLAVREEQGLAYDVHSYVSHLLDSGSVVLYAGVDPKVVERAIAALLGEMRRLREEPVPPEELTKSKELSKGRLLLRMEDTRSVSGWMGAQELLTDHVLTVDDVVRSIDSVTPQDIQRVARELFVSEKLNLAIVGPFRSERRFQSLLGI
ncbi:MAG: insulinase family protein [Chloroflexi bacterium]|nr:insulinase family protein [Chloroflexota bacterium]